ATPSALGVAGTAPATRQAGTDASTSRRSPAGIVTNGLIVSPWFLSGLVLAAQGALVPLAQRQMRHRGQHQEDADAGERDQDQCREHLRDLQLIAGFEDAVGEAGG